ncbi:MAG: hypothetical protein HOG97_01595 [Candidatus Marinimicrobia bacterium]|nr:hypothetical protein [Candidatus Neomarinimicrobiota bacterium]
MYNIDEIIKENHIALRSIKGPLEHYLGEPVARALLAYYRFNFQDKSVEEIVERVRVHGLEHGFYDQDDGKSGQSVHLLNYINQLLPEIPELKIIKRALKSKIYLAAININNAEGIIDTLNENSSYVMIRDDGAKESVNYNWEFHNISMVGLYSIATGFRIINNNVVSSLSKSDVADFVLIGP